MLCFTAENRGEREAMEHLMAPLEGFMKALGTPDVTTALKQKVVDAVLEEAGGRPVDQLTREASNRHVVERNCASMWICGPVALLQAVSAGQGGNSGCLATRAKSASSGH
jgi:hypothetical protein